MTATGTASRAQRLRVDGVLLLDKPTGASSNAALQRAKRLLNAEKAGHTGTLDPLASGLLPLCFGEATKFARFLLDASKTYEATVRFGASTSTGDAEGAIVAEAPVAFDRAALEDALVRFTGAIEQVPPRHSALKHEGRAYYSYAREGIEIERHPRTVIIHAIELLEFSPPMARMRVRCGKGTYIRALAEDLGLALRCVAHLAALRRTAAGGFTLDEAVTLEALEELPPERRAACLQPMERLVTDLPRVLLSVEQAERLRHGVPVPAPDSAQGTVAAFDDAGLIGVAEIRDRRIHAMRLCATPPRPGVAAPLAVES